MFYFFHILPPEQSSLTTKQSFWNNFCWTQYQAEMVLWIFNCRTVLWGRVDVFLYTYKSIPEKYIPVLKNKFSFPYSLSLIKSFSRSPIPSFPSLYAIVDWKKNPWNVGPQPLPSFHIHQSAQYISHAGLNLSAPPHLSSITNGYTSAPRILSCSLFKEHT